MPQSNPPSLFDDILSFWETKTVAPNFQINKEQINFDSGLNLKTKPLPPLASISVGKDLDENGNKPIKLSATPDAFVGVNGEFVASPTEVKAGYKIGAHAGVQTALKFRFPGISVEVGKNMCLGNHYNTDFKIKKKDATTICELGGSTSLLFGLGINIKAKIDTKELEKELEKQLSEKPDSTEVLKQLGTLSTELLGIRGLIRFSPPPQNPLPSHTKSTPPSPQTNDTPERKEPVEKKEERQNENENEPLLYPEHPSKNIPSSFMGKIYTALSSSYTNFKQLIKKLKPPSPTFVLRGYEKLSQFFNKEH